MAKLAKDAQTGLVPMYVSILCANSLIRLASMSWSHEGPWKPHKLIHRRGGMSGEITRGCHADTVGHYSYWKGSPNIVQCSRLLPVRTYTRRLNKGHPGHVSR